jgi:NAD(P)-dependent dehydrogenase (short-subunit alcohol dehydrogenase family)
MRLACTLLLFYFYYRTLSLFRPTLKIIFQTQLTPSLTPPRKGAFLLSQHALPLLLAHVQSSPPSGTHPPTLIFTGATASVKSNALMSSFSTGKFALRALSTSLAKEFGPQGVHVAHAVIDGIIDIEFTQKWLEGKPEEASMGSEDIAEIYWGLHTQGRRGWVNEVDVRPMLEKW